MQRVRTVRTAVLALLIALASFFTVSTPAYAQASATAKGDSQYGDSKDDGTEYYVSLGDSLAVGFQPLGPNGENIRTDNAYPIQLLPLLQAAHPNLQLMPFGCPGATAETTRHGGAAPECEYPETGTQLGDAVKFIKSHDVAVLTINLGSNDAIGDCVHLEVPSIDAGCVERNIVTLKKGLGKILEKLNKVLDRYTRRAGMTYYDPYLALALSPVPAIAALGILSLELTKKVNSALTDVYRRHHFAVAPVAEAFGTDLPLPESALAVCQLTWFCVPGRAPNIHPNQAGYKKIADAFALVLACRRS